MENDVPLSFVIISSAVVGILPAVIAANKGRNLFLWWLYGSVFFLIALVHALLISPDAKTQDEQLWISGLRKCPFCAEFIRTEAIVCKHCGRDVALMNTNVGKPMRPS
jgi:hypothetical protein